LAFYVAEDYFAQIGLLMTPLNKHVDDMNSRILQLNGAAEHVYFSADYFSEEAAELELTCRMYPELQS
jgi:hypothetical protein